MPIKVVAVGQGTYRGRFYNGTRNGGNEAANTFWLIDLKHPETGEVLQTAEQALESAEYGRGRSYGWLKRVEATEAEGAKAQRRADVDAERALDQQREMDGAGGVGMEHDAGGKVAEPASVPGPNDRKPGKRESDKSVL